MAIAVTVVVWTTWNTSASISLSPWPGLETTFENVAQTIQKFGYTDASGAHPIHYPPVSIISIANV